MVGGFTWNSIAVVGPGTALKNCIEESPKCQFLECVAKAGKESESVSCSVVSDSSQPQELESAGSPVLQAKFLPCEPPGKEHLRR